MTDTHSGKTRNKRPDFRSNAKQRRKDAAARVAAADVSELRKTRKKKADWKERSVTGVLRKEHKMSAEDKRVKFLKKLLKQIEVLLQKKESGVELDEQQARKASRYDEVIAEIEKLLDVNLSESEDEEGDDSDKESDEEMEVDSNAVVKSEKEDQSSPSPAKKRKRRADKATQ